MNGRTRLFRTYSHATHDAMTTAETTDILCHMVNTNLWLWTDVLMSCAMNALASSTIIPPVTRVRASSPWLTSSRISWSAGVRTSRRNSAPLDESMGPALTTTILERLTGHVMDMGSRSVYAQPLLQLPALEEAAPPPRPRAQPGGAADDVCRGTSGGSSGSYRDVRNTAHVVWRGTRAGGLGGSRASSK